MMMQAHGLTVLIISFTMLIPSFYCFHVLPGNKALVLAWPTAIFAAIMTAVPLFDILPC